jgi:hypothetical protein
MTDALGSSLAALWYIVFVVLVMTLPELIVYCVWRFLKDLRRIADALETTERDDGMPWRLRGSDLAQAVESRRAGIANSMFGR